MTGDPDVAIDGQAYALTAFTPIRPGAEAALRAVLDALPKRHESPFGAVPGTHFARLVIVDGLRHEGRRRPPTLRFQYLLYSTVFDGPRDAYLAALCTHMPETVTRVWGHCLGAPGADPVPFTEWLARNQVPTAAFFAPYGDATVERVRTALRTRAELTRFALWARSRTPRELRDEFERRFA